MGRNKRKAAKRAAKVKKVEKKDEAGPSAGSVDDVVAGSSTDTALVNHRTITAVPPPGHAEHSRDIHFINFSLTFHGTVLIQDTELKLSYGNRYGLIGANGAGKSTLLKVIGNREIPIQQHIDIFLLESEVPPLDINGVDYIISDVEDKVKKLEEYAEYIMENVGPDAMELDEVYERIDAMDVATAPRRAGEILHGLGFDKEMMAKPTKDFSGGWRMRIALAKALFLQPALLLLDGPTAHLDLEAIIWLESYLATYPACLVVISHSQDFLNNVCTHIIDLRLQRLTYYGGNYDQYVKTRSEVEENQEKAYKKEQEQIQSMKDYIARFGHGNAKLARQAQSKEKVLAKMMREGLTEAVVKDKQLVLRFPNPPPLPPPVINFTEVSFGYTPDNLLYTGLDFGLDLDSRVALVGPNGAGKSTLLKLIVGDLTPVEGRVQANSHLKFAWYHQHLKESMNLDLSAIEYMLEQFPKFTGGFDGMRSKVGRFGITGKAQVCPMRQLSDGQLSRVVFAWLAMQNPHMLILDEPSNSLSADVTLSLADAINHYEGGVILVSHDFTLLSNLESTDVKTLEIWVCDNRTVTKWNGDIRDYKEHLKAEVEAEHERYLADN